MKMVMGGINGLWLLDVMNGATGNCNNVSAAVAYATANSDFFNHCLQNKIYLDFIGLLDEDQAVSITVLEQLLIAGPSAASCRLVKGLYHPKVIWWHGYGAYIGSANLTSNAWFSNVECGVFYDESEIIGSPLQVQLEMLFDYVRANSSPLTSELLKALKRIQPAEGVVQRERSKLKDQFDQATKGIPAHTGLAGLRGAGAASKFSLFAQEWNATLELLRGMRTEFIALNMRPHWVDADANPTVHFDQFLHAYYYVQVRQREGDEDTLKSKELVDRTYERNRSRKEAALREAAAWWASLEDAPYGEDIFIRETSAHMRELFTKERITAWTLQDFKSAMAGVNAFKMHARQVSNVFFGLPAGHKETVEQRADRLAEWLWTQDRTEKKSLREMMDFLIWGTYPNDVAERLWCATTDESWSFSRLGPSSLGEAIGWARPDDFPPRNNRTNKALRALGHGEVRQFSSD